MQYLRQILQRIRLWRRGAAAESIQLLVPLGLPILREVSSSGVRVYSLCGSCGSRLEISATLCDACARRRSSSPF